MPAQPWPLRGLLFSRSCDTEKCPFALQPSVLPGNNDPCQLLAALPGWTATAPVGVQGVHGSGVSILLSMAEVSPRYFHALV